MNPAAQMTALPSKRGAGNRNPELGTQSTHLPTLVSGQPIIRRELCMLEGYILDIQICYVFQGSNIE